MRDRNRYSEVVLISFLGRLETLDKDYIREIQALMRNAAFFDGG